VAENTGSYHDGPAGPYPAGPAKAQGFSRESAFGGSAHVGGQIAGADVVTGDGPAGVDREGRPRSFRYINDRLEVTDAMGRSVITETPRPAAAFAEQDYLDSNPEADDLLARLTALI
jgi:hypothetical protein